jgi:tRNA-2-methylthio-N6-dimethylallyladenosine synthase
MNVLDSDKLAGTLLDLGYEATEDEGEAEVILLNTCSVREGPENKVFTELGRLRPLKKKRLRVLGVVGCVAQQEQDAIFVRAPYVDLVMGPRSILHLPELLEQARHQKAMEADFRDDSILYPGQKIRRSHPVKAFVTVMEGCNKKCAYCIVPSTRGREIYRPLESILAEVKQAVDSGFSEIELLGQNVNCWKEGRSSRFPDLLASVSDIEGVRRLRFTTSHPRHFPLAVADLMAERANICHYLHLPLQSGSSKILKEMRRQYDREWYVNLVRDIRAKVPDLALSTDVIVGFPSEAEEDFLETLDVVREIEYDSIFSFRYSPRPGTTAASAKPVPEEIARERHQRLLAAQLPIQTRRFKAFVGKTVEVLVEGRSKRGTEWMGRASDNKIVNFLSNGVPGINSFVNVEITRAGINSLYGKC